MPDLDPLSRDLLIRTVIGEADDQPPAGQAAVAHVALNRLASGKWGDSMPDVLFAKGQWEPWSTRSNELINIPRNSDRYQRTAAVVDGVLSGRIADPTGGMTHFLEPNIVQQRSGRLPDWASGPGLRIGSHVFYAPEGRVMPPQEDLLSEWTTPKKAVPASSKAASAPADDLLSEWTTPRKAAPEDVEKATATIAAWEHPQGGAGERALAGAQQAYWDVAGTLAQGAAYSTERATDFLQHLNVVSPETAKSVADWHERVNANITQRRNAFEESEPGLAGNLGRLGGQIGLTLPFLGGAGAALRTIPGAAQVAARVPGWAALPASGAAVGAGTNLLTSSSSDTPLEQQLGWGAGIGAVLGPLGAGVGRLVGGAIDHETADLARLAMEKYRIPLRADQISGNEMIRRAGGLAAKLPGTGFASNVGEQQAALNRGVANTFGETADKVTKAVWGRAADRIGNAFDQTLPRLEAYLNPSVTGRLQAIADAADYLPTEDARIVNKLRSDIVGQFGKAAITRAMRTRGAPSATPLSGTEVQALIAKGSPLDQATRSGSSNVKYLAGQMKDILLDAVGQTPTGRAKTAAAYVQNLRAFQNARFQYKNLKTVEDLVEKSPTGDISSALLQSAVRASFNNVARGGGGDLAELADIGQRFLKKPGTSGTAEHLALMKLGLAAGGGLGGIAAFDPEHFQRDAAILGLALGGARLGGGVLKSRALARAPLGRGPLSYIPSRQVGEALPSVLPAALSPRQNPFGALSPPGP